MILNIISYILLTILILMVIIVSVKITVEILYQDENLKIYIKILGFKIDILKTTNKPKKDKKSNKKSNEKTVNHTAKQINEEIVQEIKNEVVNKIEISEKKDDKNFKKTEKIQEKKKIDFDVDKIDDYIEILGDILDILEQLAFCITLKKIVTDIYIQTEDNAKTGKFLGTLWVLYGNITAFLYTNFLIKEYKINFSPVWDKEETKITGNAHIILHTRIIRVIKNIKYKKILDIRKKVLQ